MAKRPEPLAINQPGMATSIMQELPRARESTMSGKDLLLALKQTGTGADKLNPGMNWLREHPKATANEIYQAIEDAGWHEHIRPVPGRKEGSWTRENRFAGTLAKARQLMSGKTVKQLAEAAHEADKANAGGLVITEDEIRSLGLTPSELVGSMADSAA